MTKSKEHGTTILEGLKKYSGNDIAINYAAGCDITDLSKAGFEEAVSVARKSDIVVMVMGGTSATLSGVGWGAQNAEEVNTCGEGFDRTDLDFPGIQPDLIAEIAKTGKPIILVMVHGRPNTISKELALVNAVLEAWYPGEKGGDAIGRTCLAMLILQDDYQSLFLKPQVIFLSSPTLNPRPKDTTKNVAHPKIQEEITYFHLPILYFVLDMD